MSDGMDNRPAKRQNATDELLAVETVGELGGS